MIACEIAEKIELCYHIFGFSLVCTRFCGPLVLLYFGLYAELSIVIFA